MSRLQSSKKYVVLDTITGKIERGNRHAVKNLDEAQKLIEHFGENWGSRLIIVELNCFLCVGIGEGVMV